jgi:hypothetical protein
LAEIVQDEEAKLAEVHPDWQDVLSKHGGPQFAAWVEDQPRRYRDAFVRNANAIVDSASVAEFIGAYLDTGSAQIPSHETGGGER